MNLLMAILAVCVIVALNIFQLKRKNPHEKISVSFLIALVFGILIIIGFRFYCGRLFN